MKKVKVRGQILQIIFGALMLAVFIQFGWIKQTNPFWDNVIGGIVIMAGSRLLAFVFG